MQYHIAAVIAGAIAPLLGLWPAIAQSLPACQPPAQGEYLLLVSDDSDDVRSQLQQTLPPTADVTRCQYLELSVTRVGGFTDLETANTWAQYLSDIGGLATFVARPPAADAALLPPAETLPNNPASPEPTPTPSSYAAPVVETTTIPPSEYSPQLFGRGYVVLVDYVDDPSVVNLLQQTLARPVGLVSYGQRPYVLVSYTADGAIAANALQNLGDRGFSAMVVNSEEVVLLVPAVMVPQP